MAEGRVGSWLKEGGEGEPPAKVQRVEAESGLQPGRKEGDTPTQPGGCPTNTIAKANQESPRSPQSSKRKPPPPSSPPPVVMVSSDDSDSSTAPPPPPRERRKVIDVDVSEATDTSSPSEGKARGGPEAARRKGGDTEVIDLDADDGAIETVFFAPKEERD
eukprot:Hpha_TRINITY_DN19833_c0_g1::TRINITY_DN19833_c0_g1_i1::g.132141::m.132141